MLGKMPLAEIAGTLFDLTIKHTYLLMLFLRIFLVKRNIPHGWYLSLHVLPSPACLRVFWKCKEKLCPRLYSLEAGMRRGENPLLPPLWPGFNSQTWCHMCLSLLLVLILALRVFLRVLCFFSFFNNQHFKFQFHLEIVKKKSHLTCGLCNAKSLFLNFFYLFTRNELSHFT